MKKLLLMLVFLIALLPTQNIFALNTTDLTFLSEEELEEYITAPIYMNGLVKDVGDDKTVTIEGDDPIIGLAGVKLTPTGNLRAEAEWFVQTTLYKLSRVYTKLEWSDGAKTYGDEAVNPWAYIRYDSDAKYFKSPGNRYVTFSANFICEGLYTGYTSPVTSKTVYVGY